MDQHKGREIVVRIGRRSGKTRADIIRAAREVFHEHGVVRCSLEKIAKAAGVTRGDLWHFADKAELFFAMREDVFSRP